MHPLLLDLNKLGGYYQCPESEDGKLLGPLVGYAGRYTDNEGNQKQYVGKVYFNFAQGEQNCDFRANCADLLVAPVQKAFYEDTIDCVIGLPMGGIMLAVELGDLLLCDTIFAEKKILSLATKTERKKSQLVIQRHNLPRESRVLLVEDVVNNFSTTQEAIELLELMDCDVVGIACAINRSANDHVHLLNRVWPVASVVHQPTQQFRQDDPAVAEYIKAGQIVWKPKNEWARLQAAMEEHSDNLLLDDM